MTLPDSARYRPLFITGTGTDVGKTVIAGAICHGLAKLDILSTYWKPVQTGVTTEADDRDTIAALSGSGTTLIPNSYTLGPALSPDQAAELSSEPEVCLQELIRQFHDLEADNSSKSPPQYLVVEGAGGLLVPLNSIPQTWLDFLVATQLNVLVVSRTDLGTLNHTCLTVRGLQAAGVPPRAVILCGEKNSANKNSLSRLLPRLPLLEFPYLEQLSEHVEWTSSCKHLAAEVLELTQQDTEPDCDWVALDRDYCWHPFTQHETEPDPIPIAKSDGIWLETSSGQRLLDGISSWWVNSLGHSRPEITHALASQHAQLDHVLFAGATHEPAAKLAARLIELTGDRFARVFYSDNGSTSVEVALKMAVQFWANRGEPQRKKIVAFRGSYHGDTFGAMSIGAESGFFGPFRPLLFPVEWADIPSQHPSRLCPNGADDYHERLARFEELLIRERSQIAAVIMEPLVQGAAGMIVHSQAWVQAVATLCRASEIPLILDEVFTGFGRTGANFAFERAGVSPDIVCLSKAITGGTLPLAATLATSEIFQAFLSSDKRDAFLHGHSYTANPIGCRVALVAVDLFQQEKLAARSLWLEATYRKWWESLPPDWIRNPRSLGNILAFELVSTGGDDYFNSHAGVFSKLARDRNLLLRPLGNTVYLLPPMSINDEQTQWCLEQLSDTLFAWHQIARGTT